ncbi:NifB/NifX family molybdenum-iron cluster-binding protein [Lutibacter sp.]|uniref:NifB/NifX family molybdenum-iron cluster-binding protein n=1 Tax=Lutibacter sp. TaxID=1925666 RepID=UPI0035681692
MKKIAIPVDINNQLEDHFGHCDHYEIYTISDNKIVSIKPLIAEQGCGCKSNIASVLAEHGVTTMLTGGIGNGAINVLNKCNINVIRGCSGEPKDIISNYLIGKVIDSGESCLHHEHEHGHGHQCSH